MASVKSTLQGRDVKTRFPVRLQRAVGQWYKYTEPMRQARHRMLQHYAAGWYSNQPAFSQPLNLIDRGVQIIGPYLVSRNPKVMVQPKRNLTLNASFARTLELALEHLFKEIKLASHTLRPAVINSLFSMGIVKTGTWGAYKVKVFDRLHEVGMPYADNVDFEDYFTDVLARHREEAFFEGNYYLLPAEYVRDSGLYKHTDRLCEQAPLQEATRPEGIAKEGIAWQGDETQTLTKMVRLMDVWIPEENVVLTLPPEGQGDKILRRVTHDGPTEGPYDLLGYRWFPNSVVPIPPVFTWLNLNQKINRLVSRMSSQAERHKKILLYETSSAHDIQQAIETHDGMSAGVKNTDSVKEIEMGGFSPENFPFLQWLENQYSITGGNLYVIGGRETQADTLGQEQILQSNASKQLEDMVQQVHEFTKSVMEKLLWNLWTNPFIQVPVIKRLGELEIEVLYSQEAQEGDFWDYSVDLEPYSMSSMSPSMRYQQILQLISQLVLPTAQIAAAQGASLNVTELVQEAARYLDIRNLERWWNTTMPMTTALNPYQPQQGTPKNGQADGRLASSQQSGPTASNLNNQIQQQTRTGGQAASDGATVKGM